MDSRRYAVYRRALERLQGRDAKRLSAEQQDSRGLVAEVDRALLARGPSSVAPETRSASSARRSPSANDSNAL